MYTSHGFRGFEIGDVDIVKHEGVYHLFHLTLPNHDYIAHAISKDGLTWQRVKHALFISDPEAWDDDMLWTMHITPDPYKSGSWRMFYTGLQIHERGRIQRIGLARSDNLYDWEKDISGAYPLEITGTYYEHSLDEGRHWISFRDPFCFHDEDGHIYLLAAARVNYGPIIRRGCVALIRETAENQFEFLPPLYHARRYDDIEVPNVIKLGERYYVIGSIREDVKVHYWYAHQFKGPYQNFYDNVLLPQGNYAARVCWDEDRYLIWNFFFKGRHVKGHHLMVPPKELAVSDDGQLRLRTFSGFNRYVSETLSMGDLTPLETLFNNPNASSITEKISCRLACESGFEAFLLQGRYQDFMLSGEINLEGHGKCGLVLRLGDEGDGYYLSLDLFKGIAQIRAWYHQVDGGIENAYHYEQLQAAHYVPTKDPHPFKLIAYEQYLEFSLNGYVLLTLADNQFERGRVGFYVESAQLRVDNLELKILERPTDESYPGAITQDS
jgi:beta-fructofuranosidase